MKKYYVFILLLALSLAGCGNQTNDNVKDLDNQQIAGSGNQTNSNVKDPNNQQIIDKAELVNFEAVVLEVLDSFILVEPVEGSSELKSSDQIYVSLRNIDVSFDLAAGQTVKVEYDGIIAESYPAQILGASKIELVREK